MTKDLVTDFGAVGDYNPTTHTGTDNSAAFLAAMTYGGEINIPPGNFYASVGPVMVKPTILKGEGWDSAIYAGTGVSDAVTMRPTVGTAVNDGWQIRDLRIVATGRHAVCFDMTSPGAYLPFPILCGLFLNGGSGNAIHLTNPASNSFFCAKIEKVLITSGGILLENAGDSLAVRDVQINGSAQVAGAPLYGIAASFGAGAALPVFEDCNITVQGGPCLTLGPSTGAMLLVNAFWPKIIRLNSESLSAGAPPLIDLYACTGAAIVDCSFNTHNGAAAVALQGGTAYAVIHRNRFETGSYAPLVIGPGSPKAAMVTGANLFTNAGVPWTSAQVQAMITASNQSPPLWSPPNYS